MSIKTIATFAIIIGCFAVLYPKFLHPMMTKLFGLQQKNVKNEKGGGGAYYPPGRRADDTRTPHMPPKGADIRQHMRPGGPHPGMRAAAEMHRQHQTQHGTGRGMMGIVLPMYAVGIVVYLVYTLMKVFGKKEKSMQSDYDYNSEEARYNTPPQPPVAQTPQEKTKELQNLLMKADDKSISSDEMKELQRRLEETETQMSKILQAMQMVQNKVETVADDTKVRKSPDSSPNMDSSEIINKKESTGEQSENNSSPDDLKAEEVEKKVEGSLNEKITSYDSDQSNVKDDTGAASEDMDNTESCVKGLEDKCGKDKDGETEKENEEHEEEILMETKVSDDEQCEKTVRHRQVPAHS